MCRTGQGVVLPPVHLSEAGVGKLGNPNLGKMAKAHTRKLYIDASSP